MNSESIRSRSVEMYLASVMTVMGLSLTLPELAQSSPIDDALDAWIGYFGGRYGFGLLLTAVGAVRWAALIVNGWWYPTPLFRLVGCMLGAAICMMLVFVYFEARRQPLPISVAWPLVGIVFEIFSATRCARDAHALDSLGLRSRRRVRDRR